MKSMTGFAFCEKATEYYTVSLEIKSYNSRFFDLSVNLPHIIGRHEMRIREIVSACVERGKIEVTVRIIEQPCALKIEADLDAAKKYAQAMQDIINSLAYDEHTAHVPLELVIAQEGVLTQERIYNTETLFESVYSVLQNTLQEFNATRLREGEHLKTDIMKMIARLEKNIEHIAQYAHVMEAQFTENITKRFQDLLGSSYDEQRILQETAVMLVKYTINEELVRLSSHLTALRNELEHTNAPGKKVDFICQEINREINTIGSKNQILEVSHLVIDAKDALENIREQARNIE